MTLKAPSTIIGEPADALAEALESVVGDELQLVAEYDPRDYKLLYASEWLVKNCGGIEAIRQEAEDLFSYYHLDFLERRLLRDVLWLGDVGTYVTFLDHGIVVRAQRADTGVFVLVDVSASVDDVQVTIQNTL